jgi:NADH:ubiquinone oxidoreductase subunit 3 (subunit A)
MRIRTADILLAKQTLYQLSYTPFQGGANDKEKRLNCALRYYITQIFLVVFRRGLLRAPQPHTRWGSTCCSDVS